MQIDIKKDARKYLESLSMPDKVRISIALQGLTQTPPKGDIMPYAGTDRLRLKVGSYRILYKIVGETVVVTHIKPRGQAYTKETRG